MSYQREQWPSHATGLGKAFGKKAKTRKERRRWNLLLKEGKEDNPRNGKFKGYAD